MEATNIVKHLKNIDKLCRVEQFILTNGRAITQDDKDILFLLKQPMDNYTYGWHIWEEDMLTQLNSINEFRQYIIRLANLV